MEKDEIIRTTEPENDIPCRKCRHRLQPIEVMGERVERHKFGTCLVYDDKPQSVLWKGEKCEFYQPE